MTSVSHLAPAVNPVAHQSSAAQSAVERLTQSLSSALSSGDSRAIDALGPQLADLAPDDLNTVLQARGANHYIPGLNQAMRLNQSAPIDALTRQIANLSQSAREAIDWLALLRAPYPDGTPALYSSLFAGRADSIDAFSRLLALIPESNAATLDWNTLLQARHADGTPPLFTMLASEGYRNEHQGSATAWVRLVSNLPESARRALDWNQFLLAQDSQGVPGLSWALVRGRDQAIALLADLVLAAPEDARARLEWARLIPQSREMFDALYQGQAKAISALGALLRCIPDAALQTLDPDLLLQTTGQYNRDGLSAGTPEAIEAFLQIKGELSARKQASAS